MTAPVPAEKAIEIYNELVALTVDDQQAIVQRLFKLRTLERQLDFDFGVRVALIAGLLMSGQRDEAVRRLEELRPYAKHADTQQVVTYIRSLVNVGDIATAREVVESAMEQPGARVLEDINEMATLCAIAEGDANWLDELAAQPHNKDLTILHHYVWALKKSGLRQFIAEHQRIVLDVLRPHLCELNVFVVADEVEGPAIAFKAKVLADRPKRREMQMQIAQALTALYTRNEMPGASYVPYLTVVLDNLPASPLVAA